MKRYISFGILWILWLAACSPVSNPAALTPIAPAITHTIEPVLTPQPTETETHRTSPDPAVTATQSPPLAEKGPYLAYLTIREDGGRALTLLNADASGRVSVPLPQNIFINSLEKSMSPDGKWLAFMTNSGGRSLDLSSSSDLSDLTLKLMHLPDGDVITVTRLIRQDYIDNFARLAAYLIQNDSEYSGLSLMDAKESVIYDFFAGITSMGWSPDSHYLAFSGEIDGWSSDLYVYDVQRSKISRRSYGPEQIAGEISWSPDGKWILYQATNIPKRENWAPNIYALESNRNEVKKLGDPMNFLGWISSDTFLQSESASGAGTHDISSVNVVTGKRTSLWYHSYSEYAMDPGDGKMIVCGQGYFFLEDLVPSGLYVSLPHEEPRSILPIDLTDCFRVYYRGAQEDQFVLVVHEQGVLGISRDGTVRTITEDFSLPKISPDYQWMLLTNEMFYDNLHPVELYDREDHFVRQLTTAHVDDAFWRPDSLGVFYRAGRYLYYQPIPDGEPRLVEEKMIALDGWKESYKWVQK